MRTGTLTLGSALGVLLTVCSASVTLAADGGGVTTHWGDTYLLFATILVFAVIGMAVEKWKQPDVVGMLLAGIALSGLGHFGWSLIDELRSSEVIAFMASFGSLLLLLIIGLESNISDMRKVGLRSIMVAITGVALPLVLGRYVYGPMYFADEGVIFHWFLGASLVATSVGITAMVFLAKGINKTTSGQTVLGAAVIDDVIGLMILALVSAMAGGAVVTTTMILEISAKSIAFLAGSIALGGLLAGPFSRLFSLISNKEEMKLFITLILALLFGWGAELAGLEPIIGAFFIGLMLDPVKYKHYADTKLVVDLIRASLNFKSDEDKELLKEEIRHHQHAHVEQQMALFAGAFIRVFFVYTGLQIDFESLLKPDLYWTAIVISFGAIVGKVVAGAFAKGGLNEKLLVGFSMVPRGEVGLIFAATGKSLDIFSDRAFSVVILVVIITTFISPPAIGYLANRVQRSEARQATAS